MKRSPKLGQPVLEFSGIRLMPVGAPMSHSTAISAPDCQSRSHFIVVSTPILHFLACVVKAQKPMRVQAFGSELALKDSMKLLSVGLPSREKSNTTPFW
jgi:hypothetical protein